MKEKEGKLFVTTDLPGLKKEDVKVQIEGDNLVVEGERKRESEEKREGYYHSGRRGRKSQFRMARRPKLRSASGAAIRIQGRANPEAESGASFGPVTSVGRLKKSRGRACPGLYSERSLRNTACRGRT